ncbi:MAG: sensor hybrid histidine kinase [Verrucomicrobia bacterium]|nr:sensor hybrid histidine kinase [Verrucomicrobiota bacterium]
MAAMENKSGLTVLHVEDNVSDAELIRMLLEEEWPRCRIERVQTRDDFLRALSGAHFDLILSDFSLPNFDGLSALVLARQRSMGTPFIFISGTIGEDNAVEALRRGATDYVIKDRPARLIPAIHRALEQVAVHEQRRHAEAQLRDQAELLDKARDAIVVSNLEGKISYWNQGAERVYGWTAAEALGRSGRELFGPGAMSDIGADGKALGNDDEWRGEVRLKDKAGKPLIVETRVTVIRDGGGRPRSHLIIGTDVTEQKTMEQQFLQAQRMESIGILAGGIAHDLNNALAPILMGLGLARQRVTDPEIHRLLEVMEKSALHGASLVRQVLAFARGTHGERTVLNASGVIRDVVTLLVETLPRSISIETDVAAHLAPISADSTQLSQVLMNLGVNARDAMPEGGRLLIRALNTVVSASRARGHPGVTPGDFVLVTVVDNGSGMPPEIIERIFDPFFTTKGAGKGTGLGLSTVMGIVKSHDGFMEVQSQPGQGTTFSLYFPAMESKAPEAPVAREAPLPSGRGETILVIDDEPDVREVVQALLESCGYRVLLASDGLEGIALFSQHRPIISAVVTDMIMPAMQGTQVVKELRAIDPEARIVAMSGVLGNKPEMREEPGRFALLQKPMTGSSLLQALDRVLPKK